MRRVAVIDGTGASATVELYLEDDDGEVVEELPWPDDWARYVTAEFLKQQGYDVIIA